MQWFKRLLGFEETAEPQEPVEIEHRHMDFDCFDRTEVTVLVKVRFRDGREIERREIMQRNQIETLDLDLINDLDIREAAIYEELSHHDKSFDGDSDLQLITTGVIIGATVAAGGLHGV